MEVGRYRNLCCSFYFEEGMDLIFMIIGCMFCELVMLCTSSNI
jgi:hypothetical protein